MLHQADTEILFPPRVIASLRNLRGHQWQELIDRLCNHQQETHIEILAFSLMMIRQNNCLQCHAHSYRAMRGCTLCTQQMVNRIKESDTELVQQWQNTVKELQIQNTTANSTLS